MTVDVEKISAVGFHIIHPIWDKGITQSGLYTGEQYYDEKENPPGWFNPTSGIVISAPKRSHIKKGDKVFFTWNGFDYDNCISPGNKENIWAIKNGIFAFERDGVIKGTTFLLLDKVFTTEKEEQTDSGLVLSGYRVVGGIHDPTVVKHEQVVKMHGVIKYLPVEMEFTKLLNPFSGQLEEIKVGKKVEVYDTADVVVEVNGEKVYRTRFWELIYVYD